MKSMTAYGNSKFSNEIYEISLEIKSLNGKFLDINFNLPKELQSYEANIRSLISKHIFRGKIYVLLNFKDLSCSDKISINENKLLKYFEAYKSICDLTTSNLNFGNFIKLEEIFTFKNTDYLNDFSLKDILLNLTNRTNISKNSIYFSAISYA